MDPKAQNITDDIMPTRYVKRDKLLEVCQMMVASRGITLRGEHHPKGINLVDQHGKKVASLHGHVGRGNRVEVPLGSALVVIEQVAAGNDALYGVAKYLLTNRDFRSLKPALRVDIK